MKDIAKQEGPGSHFSGHETFPLRQMWLKKAFDCAHSDWTIPKSTFSNADAIALFGVGKNMVASIKHWALACEVMREENGSFKVTEIAREIFNDDGCDPYSENPATAWFAHWQLAGRGFRSTTWFWLFNHVLSPSFTRDDLETPLAEYALRIDKKRRLSALTLSRDIETCLRSYAPRATGASPEDFAEPMLGELGLIGEERKGHFAFRRGQKTTLPDGLFAYALLDHWDRTARGVTTMSFEAVAYGEGSPGRVFKLDEDSIAERLFALDDLTGGILSWTDTAGLRQVHRKNFESQELLSTMIRKAYD
ncbi:MAG: DUF4007 family protein [Candidatus Accumulibacter sp.]|uniref:DUF4007 family protein n=1 Tax=Candidatus Accumulibacter proximus TaxID=2954385 RepID=A0A935Q484_9PROT|nr:DUF4007 family protein [Candidatus Accumulibacter proximus]